MADPPASPDEDWGDAAIDWDGMLEEGFFSAEAYQLLEGPGGEEQETTSEEPQESAEVLATGSRTLSGSGWRCLMCRRHPLRAATTL